MRFFMRGIIYYIGKSSRSYLNRESFTTEGVGNTDSDILNFSEDAMNHNALGLIPDSWLDHKYLTKFGAMATAPKP